MRWRRREPHALIDDADVYDDVVESPPRRRGRRRAAVVIVALLVAAGPVPYFLWLRWFTPPVTTFQAQDAIVGHGLVQDDVAIERVSRNFLLATLVLEDVQLADRRGAFDWEQFTRRIEAYRAGQADPSGSTIPQQYVKNLLLWRHKDPLRKALEAWWSTLYSHTVPPKRQLELYINDIEFGPGLWGVCAASWRYLGVPPSQLSIEQSVALLQLLPNPKGRTFQMAPAPQTRQRIRANGGLALTERIGVSGLASDSTASPSCQERPSGA